MLLRLLEEMRPIDKILFCDTGLEYPQMYEHLKKLEQHIDREIIRLKADQGFEYYFFDYTPKRKNPALMQYRGMSWAGPYNRWCTGMLKTRMADAYLRDLRKKYDVIEYIGIAADEKIRIKNKIAGDNYIKYHLLQSFKSKKKLKLTVAYIINALYVSGKAYLCTAFCKIINKLII